MDDIDDPWFHHFKFNDMPCHSGRREAASPESIALGLWLWIPARALAAAPRNDEPSSAISRFESYQAALIELGRTKVWDDQDGD